MLTGRGKSAIMEADVEEEKRGSDEKGIHLPPRTPPCRADDDSERHHERSRAGGSCHGREPRYRGDDGCLDCRAADFCVQFSDIRRAVGSRHLRRAVLREEERRRRPCELPHEAADLRRLPRRGACGLSLRGRAADRALLKGRIRRGRSGPDDGARNALSAYAYDFWVNEKTWATNYKSYATATAVRWTTERTGARSLWFYGDIQTETDATNTEGAVITASTPDVHIMGRIWDNQRPYLAFTKNAITDEHITKHILSYGTPLLADSYQPHILRGENELAPYVEQGTILGLTQEDNMPMYIESYTVGGKNLVSLMASGSVANSEYLISNLSRNDIRLATYGHNMGKAALNVTVPRVQTKGLKTNDDGAYDVKVKIAFNKDNSLMAYELFGNTALYNEMYLALFINGKVQMSDVNVSILHTDNSKDKLITSTRTVYSKGQSFYMIPLNLFTGKSEDRLLIEYTTKPPASQTKYYPTVQLLPINVISSGSNYSLANPAIKYLYPSEVRNESPAMQILDRNTGIPVYHVPNTNKWTDAMGEPAGIARSGSFENAPTPVNVGFQYFCTTKAGKQYNKPLFWTGNGWVDAMGESVK